MKKYEIVVTNNVWYNLNEIKDYIVSVASERLAEKYTDQLLDDIRALSNPLLVHAIQPSQWRTAKRYHRNAKRLITKNRKWNIIFHTQGNYVIVDAIIPSTLMK